MEPEREEGIGEVVTELAKLGGILALLALIVSIFI
jgi:hypothetical protein